MQVRSDMSRAYDAMDNLLISIDAQIQSLVITTLATISGWWNDLTSWLDTMKSEGDQTAHDEGQRLMRNIIDPSVLQRAAGDFGGSRNTAGTYAQFSKGFRGQAQNWTPPMKSYQHGGTLEGAGIVGEAGPEVVVGDAEVIPMEGNWYERLWAILTGSVGFSDRSEYGKKVKTQSQRAQEIMGYQAGGKNRIWAWRFRPKTWGDVGWPRNVSWDGFWYGLLVCSTGN